MEEPDSRPGGPGDLKTVREFPMLPIGFIGLPGSLWSLEGRLGVHGGPRQKSPNASLAAFCFLGFILEGQEDQGTFKGGGPL